MTDDVEVVPTGLGDELLQEISRATDLLKENPERPIYDRGLERLRSAAMVLSRCHKMA
jgi:hypothetical protein